jgi:hypothetical protein
MTLPPWHLPDSQASPSVQPLSSEQALPSLRFRLEQLALPALTSHLLVVHFPSSLEQASGFAPPATQDPLRSQTSLTLQGLPSSQPLTKAFLLVSLASILQLPSSLLQYMTLQASPLQTTGCREH